jgi:hypothetical protein
MKIPRLKAGDWVEVRSKKDILMTLDSSGQLDGMPFMPEMFAFCGQRFRVYKRAHKTCDTVFPIRARRIHRAVHLETRCDGRAHGGCQAGCLIFWKEAWLTRVDGAGTCAPDPLIGISATTEASVWAHAQIQDEKQGTARYVCQATQLPYATESLAWWDLRQYLEDYRSGNVGLRRIFCGSVYSLYYGLSQAGIGLGPAMRWCYDVFHPLWGGTLFPRRGGNIPTRHPTPTETLNLEAGELVRVKSHRAILRTLNTDGKNRGMFWDAEMVPYCGKTYRVLRRVTRIVNESTGEMQDMKTPCIILDSVVCQGRFSHCRMFCPRSIYSYWREIWLERVEKVAVGDGSDKALAVAEDQRTHDREFRAASGGRG